MSKRKRSKGENEADQVDQKATKRPRHDEEAKGAPKGTARHDSGPLGTDERYTIQQRDLNSKGEPKLARQQGKLKKNLENTEGHNDAKQRENMEKQLVKQQRRKRKRERKAKRGIVATRQQERKDGKPPADKRGNGELDRRNKGKRPSWRISEPVGGQMLDLDPLFAPDGESVAYQFSN